MADCQEGVDQNVAGKVGNVINRMRWWMSFLFVYSLSGVTLQAEQAPPRRTQDDQSEIDWLRGSGHELEMRFRGTVSNDISINKTDAVVAFTLYYLESSETFSTNCTDNTFDIWLPVGRRPFHYMVAEATDEVGNVAVKPMSLDKWRQVAIDDLELKLQSPTREVTIQATHRGKPVTGFEVRVKSNLLRTIRKAVTAEQDDVVLKLLPAEELQMITIWKERPEKLLGGCQFFRKGNLDPKDREFTLELYPCRSHRIVMRAEDGKPVNNVRAKMEVAAMPHYNYLGQPDDVSATSNELGIADYEWMPRLEKPHQYVELLDKNWIRVKQSHSNDETELIIKARLARHEVAGKIRVESGSAGGFPIEMHSFQGEEEGDSDVTYAISDRNGNFVVDVLPDATYSPYVVDQRWVSKPIDLISFQSLDQITESPILDVEPGIPVKIRLTSGMERLPWSNVDLRCRSEHDFHWRENGETHSGVNGRSVSVLSDQDGWGTIYAAVGPLKVSVYTPEWQCEKKIIVATDRVNLVELHREVDEPIEFHGTLVSPEEVAVTLDGTEIMVAAIDGESDEEFTVQSDSKGEFRFKTKARKLAFFATTPDNKAACTGLCDDPSQPITFDLKPTQPVHGRIVRHDGTPVSNHRVYTYFDIRFERRYDLARSTGFSGKRYEVRTDAEGRFVFDHLPCNTKIDIHSDDYENRPNHFMTIGTVKMLYGEEQAELVKRVGPATSNEPKTIAKRWKSIRRDCQLNGWNTLLIIHDPANARAAHLIDQYVLNDAANKMLCRYMDLQLGIDELQSPESIDLAKSLQWPTLEKHEVFIAIYGPEGDELCRRQWDAKEKGLSELVGPLISDHAPKQIDAETKWKVAFETARRENKKVWMRVSGRHCGPCFSLTRWLDTHRKILEQDFVMLKIDGGDFLHAKEVSERLLQGRTEGIPFHGIFNTDETLLVDSHGPDGNIGSGLDKDEKLHLRAMLEKTVSKITSEDIDLLLSSSSN